jgi:UDP-N-acetylglucosamine:LPS N-acetylglucosamine transferase
LRRRAGGRGRAMAKVALISSAGGHLAEVLSIGWEFRREHDLIVCVTGFPTGRGATIDDVRRVYLLPTPWRYWMWPVVGRLLQWTGIVLAQAIDLFRFAWIFLREKPDYLISVGAEIAIPAFLVNRVFFRKPALYVESLARIATPSLTGRVLRHLADRILVQWPKVLDYYGAAAEYRGRLL